MTLSDTFKTCLNINRRENVLLVTDTDMDEVANIILNAIIPLSEDPAFLSMTPQTLHGEEPPSAVARAMAASDVVILATSKSLSHTRATKRAIKNGARIASMPGITTEMLYTGGMTADFSEISKFAQKVANILTHGKTVEIKTPKGTDFRAEIFDRKGYADTGLITKKGTFGNLPGGEAFIAPVEGRTNGRLVIDGSIASSGISNGPIIVEVKDGKASYTDYGELDNIFNEIENASYIGEFGIGVNPKAKLIGNILEDEKVLGTTHVAFGNNINFGGNVNAEVHLDGIIKHPTVLVDGRVVLQNGSLRL